MKPFKVHEHLFIKNRRGASKYAFYEATIGKLISILNKLHSNNISQSTLTRINGDCINLGIDDKDELFVKFYAT